MEAFATAAQYIERFGPVADTEMLEACLEDATAAVIAELSPRGIGWEDPDELMAYNLMCVCRSVANRLMPSGTDVPVGVTQKSVTAGSYNETVSYTPSYGTPKLLEGELRLLGIGGGRIGWARLGGRDDQGD